MTETHKRRKFLKNAFLAGLSISVLPKFSHASSNSSLIHLNKSTGKRIGIIGLDTSHAQAFAKTLNDANAGNKYKNYRITAAYPHGSRDIKTSYERIPAITAEVKSRGVEIVDSIQDLLTKVDVVLLETNDGRMHKEQALEVIKAGKPLFIDKPIANSIQDAKIIFDAAKKNNVPVFSSSSLRFSKGIQEIRNGKVGTIHGADIFSPSPLEPTHTDFYWYGIHGVEMLFTVMGAGCENVTRFYTPEMDVVVGKWKDGRIGTFRGIREPQKARSYGGYAYGDKGAIAVDGKYMYEELLLKIIDFFETGMPPVTVEETLDICAFIEAAQLSKNKGGKTIKIVDIYKKL